MLSELTRFVTAQLITVKLERESGKVQYQFFSLELLAS